MLVCRRIAVMTASGSMSNLLVRGTCTSVTRAREAPRLGLGQRRRAGDNCVSRVQEGVEQTLGQF